MSYTTLLMLCITVLILTHINYKYTLGAHLMPEALFNRICSLLQWQIQGWFVTKITRNYWRWLQFEIARKCALSENETHPSRVLYWRSSPLVGAITLYMSDILKSSTKKIFFSKFNWLCRIENFCSYKAEIPLGLLKASGLVSHISQSCSDKGNTAPTSLTLVVTDN